MDCVASNAVKMLLGVELVLAALSVGDSPRHGKPGKSQLQKSCRGLEATKSQQQGGLVGKTAIA